MSKPRLTIGILEAGPVERSFDARYRSQSDFFLACLGPHAPDVGFESYPVYEGALPPAPQTCDGYLITGSRYSVYDPLPWIAPLKDFVKTAAEDRPVVGVCFGHQLVAEIFGGRVAKSERGWGVGVHRYAVAGTEWWMAPPLQDMSLIVSHQDQVIEPPPGAAVLGGSPFCPIGMMRIGANVLSLQPHPEAPRDYCAKLFAGRRQRIGNGPVDSAIASLARRTDDDTVARWLLRFLDPAARKP
ncbi:MAG: glutamine amidotransferase-related protein [Hyphomicrobiaceae bacterium]